MRTSDFDFDLPQELIAQEPTRERDQSRLLVLDRRTESIVHAVFSDLPSHVQPGDVVVLNDSRVLPARLRGLNRRTGGRFEVLLLHQAAINDWWAMVRPGNRAREGTLIDVIGPSGLPSGIHANVVEINAEGHRRLAFHGAPDLIHVLERIGETPLPPYIRRETGATAQDRERYQTVYAEPAGSVAAPTAGLHFTPRLLKHLQAKGATLVTVTLHVGPGTFAPVKTESLAAHSMHHESYEITAEAAQVINEAKRLQHRILAVGSTSLRVLESAARDSGFVEGRRGTTDLFLYPPCSFRVVDCLLTNFHLPRSTLLMLVSAFASPGRTDGTELIRRVYAGAIVRRYRFFSFGDAMLLL
jgi:S-adenosylmethionine:tRNA ribosyltransferase-isomerase